MSLVSRAVPGLSAGMNRVMVTELLLTLLLFRYILRSYVIVSSANLAGSGHTTHSMP